MVILEPDGKLSRYDQEIDLVQQGSDESTAQHPAQPLADASDSQHQAYDVFGLNEVAREIEQAVVHLSAELHQLASVHQLALSNWA